MTAALAIAALFVGLFVAWHVDRLQARVTALEESLAAERRRA